MKKIALVAAMALLLASCQSIDLWDEVPSNIQHFISEYFPGMTVNDYAEIKDTYYVRLTDGPGLTFGPDYDWTSIKGYGMPLPKVLLYDQLPEPLYQYLEATESADAVFALTRSSSTYQVELLDSSLTYDVDSQKVSQSFEP